MDKCFLEAEHQCIFVPSVRAQMSKGGAVVRREDIYEPPDGELTSFEGISLSEAGLV